MLIPTKYDFIDWAKSLLNTIVVAFIVSAILVMGFYLYLVYSAEKETPIDWSGFFGLQVPVLISLLFLYGIRKVQKARKQLKFRDGKLILVDRKLTRWERLFTTTTIDPDETKGG